MLVLDVRTPEPADIHTEVELLQALAASSPRVMTWLLSLLTLAIFWVGQQTQLNQIASARSSSGETRRRSCRTPYARGF